MFNNNIYNELYDLALLRPCYNGANQLKIITGYASSAMAFHHLEDLAKNNKYISVELLIGMSPKDGINLANHKGFQEIVKTKNMRCNYIYKPPPVHSKAYIWLNNNYFHSSYIGSANYSQNAFLRGQQEILTYSNDSSILNYFEDLNKRSISCFHGEVENYVKICRNIEQNYNPINVRSSNYNNNIFQEVEVSLIPANGQIQSKAGLNWGQRAGREKNQAYIQLPPAVYNSNFFPIRGTHFTILTDDGKTLICTRAQKNSNGAAIETPHNNSLLGKYFRGRLNLRDGFFVRTQDLENYGRTSVIFKKIDNENYYMDFSRPTFIY